MLYDQTTLTNPQFYKHSQILKQKDESIIDQCGNQILFARA